MSFGTRTREPLRCVMSVEEIARKADEQASLIEQYRAAEIDKAELAKQYGERLKELRSNMERLAHDIRTKTEERTVDIYEVPRWTDGLVDVVREDTGEVVRTRVLQPAERQERLKGIEGGN